MNVFNATDLYLYLSIDVTLLLLCTVVLFLAGRMTFAHPAFFYLFYHFYSYTFRLWAVINGSETMYEDVAHYGYEAVSFGELARAAVWMDVALVCFTIGCLIAAKVTAHKRLSLPQVNRVIHINTKVVVAIIAVCFPVGLFFFLVKRGGLDVELGDFGMTGYSSVFTMWPMACLGIAIYLWGFRWYLLVGMSIYLAVVSLQGYHRFMVLLPILMMMYIYLFRNNKKWPSFPFIVISVILFAVFPYLKNIGRAFQAGDMRMLNVLLTQGSRDVLSFKKTTSVDFLDQAAAVMTLTDRQGRIYYGSNYLALLAYPIPRFMWQDKPRFTQYMFDIATPQRPIDKDGRVATYVGEAYVNFREPGIVIIAMALGLWLSRWYYTAVLYPHNSLRRFIYIIFAPALIQVWRDGLPSLVMFTFVHLMPVMFITLLHLVPSLRGRQQIFVTPELALPPHRRLPPPKPAS